MLVRFTAKLAEPAQATETLSLTWRDRNRTRYRFTLGDGRAAAILLPRGQTLEDGDHLIAEDGTVLQILAAPESLMRVSAPDAFELIRLTYHLANRHVSAMITPDALYIEPDPVLSQMVLQLGGAVCAVEAPFTPERGAYHGGHHHSHGELEDEDRSFGNIGEFLSRRAHGQR